jgi:recombinational DNA repair ATPase RecF
MRIESIELSWFRGAGESICLNPQAKSVVIYGANGAGKSSFADAFEYVVSKGKISHLAHEYSGLHQRRGLRNTHAPEGAQSQITIHFQNKTWIIVNIRPDGVAKFQCEPANVISIIQSWDLERFILRQDEVARFIHATKGEKYSVLLPLLGLEAVEHAASNLRALSKALEERGKLVEQRIRKDGLVSEVLQHLPDMSPATINQALYKLISIYLKQSSAESFEELLEGVNQAIDASIRLAEPEQRRFLILQQIHQIKLGERLAQLTEAEHQATLETDEFIDRNIAVLEAVRDYIQTIREDQSFIDCPACGREIPVEDFTEHVHNELLTLSSARASRSLVIGSRQNLQRGIVEIGKWLLDNDFHQWLEDPMQAGLKEVITRLTGVDITQCEHRWDEAAWNCISQEIPKIVKQLDSLIIKSPPSSQQLFQDQQMVKALKAVPEVEHLQAYIDRLELILKYLSNAEEELRGAIKHRTLKTTRKVSGEIQRLWAKMHPNEPIEKVELYIPKDADRAIDICLKFFGVDQPSPRLTLSEGHRNSLGLCIFLALVSQEADKSRPIVLDDVVSSLDREHRGMLTKVLLEDFADRQVILLTHDREWFTELRSRLPSKQWDFVALRPWLEPRIGIQWSQSKGTFGDARSLVADNPEAAGNRVRAIMDTELAIIAERLQVRVPFARGDQNDRRTCMEFIERIISEAKDRLRKSDGGMLVDFTAPIEDWQEARSLLVSWANRASHRGSLSSSEAEYLIHTCEKALSHFRCTDCGEPIWFAEQTNKNRLQCSCGKLIWKIE